MNIDNGANYDNRSLRKYEYLFSHPFSSFVALFPLRPPPFLEHRLRSNSLNRRRGPILSTPFIDSTSIVAYPSKHVWKTHLLRLLLRSVPWT